MTSEVTYQLRNGVAWLTISRPEARNSLNKAVRNGAFAGVRRFTEDDAANAPLSVTAGKGSTILTAGYSLRASRSSGSNPSGPRCI
jgi:enoyl-CoA hydratase/carnithine racemase